MIKLSKLRAALIVGIALTVGACAAQSSHILVGASRPPIPPADVKIYTTPPAHYEEIALLDASSGGGITSGGQKSVDQVIDKLKLEAAQLGANGVILGDMTDRQTGAVSTGSGTSSYSGNSAVGVGVSGGAGIYQKSAKGTAIYVTEGMCIVGCEKSQ